MTYFQSRDAINSFRKKQGSLFRLVLGLVVILSIVMPASRVVAEGITENQATDILNELKQIRQLLEKSLKQQNVPTKVQKSPEEDLESVVLSVEGEPFKGNPNAKVTIIEFSDYECPFCARHFKTVLPQIERDYIEPGKVKYVFRDFPLESLHNQAIPAAVAANCAGHQEKYWGMHDRIFENQLALGGDDVLQHALALEVNLESFLTCIDSHQEEVEIREDQADGSKAGVRGTPTFFLGLTQGESTEFKPLKILRGAQSYSQFQQIIDSLLEAS